MKKSILILLLFVFSIKLLAQENILNSHFLLNKRKFNPAYVQSSSTSLLGLNYRGQLGNENAPSMVELYSQHGLSNRFFVGGQLSFGESILLKELNALISSTYIVPIAKNHRLNFGLAGGILNSRIDLTNVDYDSNDRLLMDLESTLYPDLKFGIYYTYKSLNVGLSLPQLFKTQSFSYDSSAIDLDKFDINLLNEIILVAEYTIGNISKDFSLSPYALYRRSNTLYLGEYIEGGLMANFRNMIQLGATYSTYDLISGILTIDATSNIRINYAYQLSVGNVQSVYSNTHEIGLVMRFGKKGKSDNSRPNHNEISQNDLIQVLPGTNDSTTHVGKGGSEQSLEVMEIQSYAGTSPDFFELMEGIYIAFGQSTNNKHAEKQFHRLSQNNFKLDIRYSSNTRKHYIILDKKFSSINEAKSYMKNTNLKGHENCNILLVK